jgi:ribosomal protein S18 acetylase RimI-like enzyme
MSEVSIVPTEERFVEEFEAAVDAVARERRYLAILKGPGKDAARSFVRRILEGQGVQSLAVTPEDRVVGWCDIIRKPPALVAHVGRLGMGVVAGYRGQGIGERLARSAIEMAVRAGIEKVELEVFVSNAPAIALYTKLGFVSEGVRRMARKLDGEYENEQLMAFFPSRVPHGRASGDDT